jgi:hypothetical protein
MRDVLRTVAALRSALSTRRDLLLENLALRHQLRVLARSDRRFRADRLLWLCLRRWWPRWTEALVLVQPATVARRARGHKAELTLIDLLQLQHDTDFAAVFYVLVRWGLAAVSVADREP